MKVISASSNKEVIELLKNKSCDIKPVSFESIKKGKLPYKATGVYIEDYSSVVTHIKEPYFKTMQEHLDKTFVMLGYQGRLIKSIQKQYPKMKIIKVDNLNKALKMVESKEAFGFIGKSLSCIYNIQKYHSSTLKVMNQFAKSDLGMGVKEDDKILFSLIEKALNSIGEKERITIRNNWAITTKEIKQDYTIVWQVGIALFILVLLLLYFMSVKQKKELELQNRFATSILNSQVNFILITSGEKLYKTNQATLDFLGYTTLDDFHKEYD